MADMEKYPALTVEVLKGLCEEQIKKGNGDKKILISSDDEGNNWHGLFYGFCADKEEIGQVGEYGLFHDDVDAGKIVLLG